MSSQLYFLVFTILLIDFTNAVDLPEPMKKCHLGDEPCIFKQANIFLSEFPKGIPELGFSSMEPFELGDIDVRGPARDAIRFDLFMKDLKIHNYSSMRVTSFKGLNHHPSVKPLTIFIDTFTPSSTLKGRYEAKGNFLVLPFNGHGDMEFTLTRTKTKIKLILKESKDEQGRMFLKVMELTASINPEHVHINMTNLMNGNPEISSTILDVINENWKLVSQDVIDKVTTPLVAKHGVDVQKFLKKIEFNDLFLPETNETVQKSKD